MKRRKLIAHLRTHGCELVREGGSHSWWWNPKNRVRQAVPRHAEIKTHLARAICRKLGIPDPGGES